MTVTTNFDEFPEDEHFRTPEERERYGLGVARSSFAVDMFDDLIFNFTSGNVLLIRRGELVGEINASLIPKLGGLS